MFVHVDYRGSNQCRKIQPGYGSYLITDLLNPRSRVPRNQQAFGQSINSPHFMEPEGSLPHSQVPANCTYPEPARPSPYPTSHFQKIQLIIILPSTPGSFKWSLSLIFPTKTLYTPLLSPTRAIYPAYLILLDWITRKIFGEQYRSLSSSLCSFSHSPVTSSLLGPNILLNALFSNILSLRASLNVSDQVSHP